jgi:hypothetical protein
LNPITGLPDSDWAYFATKRVIRDPNRQQVPLYSPVLIWLIQLLGWRSGFITLNFVLLWKMQFSVFGLALSEDIKTIT